MSDMKQWVLGFFDQGYRTVWAEVLGPERTENEVADLCRLLLLPEGARVLDLCCGDGRHTVPLQRRGYRMVGLDLAPLMLGEARRRAERVLPEEAAAPLWVRADATRSPLRPVFDAALLLYNSFVFGTRAEAQAILRTARAALRPGGQLLLDCLHRDAQVRQIDPAGARELAQLAVGPVLVERWLDPVAGLAQARVSWDDGGERREKLLRHQLFTATEILAMLREAGFQEILLYSDYRGEPFDYSRETLVAHASC